MGVNIVLTIYGMLKAQKGTGGVATLTLKLATSLMCGPGTSYSIVTDYGLDGPGSNPRGDETFRPPRPALGPPHQPPIKWAPGLSRG